MNRNCAGLELGGPTIRHQAVQHTDLLARGLAPGPLRAAGRPSGLERPAGVGSTSRNRFFGRIRRTAPDRRIRLHHLPRIRPASATWGRATPGQFVPKSASYPQPGLGVTRSPRDHSHDSTISSPSCGKDRARAARTRAHPQPSHDGAATIRGLKPVLAPRASPPGVTPGHHPPGQFSPCHQPPVPSPRPTPPSITARPITPPPQPPANTPGQHPLPLPPTPCHLPPHRPPPANLPPAIIPGHHPRSFGAAIQHLPVVALKTVYIEWR